MKILVISTLYPPNAVGGAEMTAHMLARRFLAWGHEVVSVSLAPDGVSRTLTVDGVRCHYVPLANVYWTHADPRPTALRRALWHAIDAFNPVMGVRLGRIMDRERPDVAHMHNLQGFSVAAWWAAHRRRLPLVQTVHDYYLACPRSVMFRNGRNCDGRCLNCRVYRGPRRALSRIPHTVTAVSRRLLDRITATGLFAGVPRRVVIRNGNEGRNGNEAAGGPPPAATARAGRGSRQNDGPQAPLRVGYLGRLDPLKGIEVLIRASELLPDERFAVSIAGSGAPKYVATLRSSTNRRNVRFLGFVDPAAFFGEIDVLVVPSVWEEPAGRVIHEAYAYGVPVIASRAGGPAEMIVEGRTGYLFEAGNPGALAAALDHARQDGARTGSMSRACLEESRKYDGDRIAHEYMDVLEAAASAKPSGRGARTASDPGSAAAR